MRNLNTPKDNLNTPASVACVCVYPQMLASCDLRTLAYGIRAFSWAPLLVKVPVLVYNQSWSNVVEFLLFPA